MKKLKLIYKEISNYFFLRRTLSREILNLESKWYSFKLRKNWFGRIYTVVSLREEDMGEEEIVRNWRAMEMMRPINEYLSSLGLQEIIFPSIESIPGTQSFLVVYSPLFNYLSFSWVLKKLFYLALMCAGGYFVIKHLW
jgi:hypothetical protein